MNPELSIVECFERQVAVGPDRIAITCANSELSFGELNAQANGLAVGLTVAGIGHGDRVVILSDNSPVRLIAALAVLKTGATFVQLIASDPDIRLRQLLEHVETSLVLVSREYLSRLQAFDNPKPRLLEITDGALVPQIENLGVNLQPDDLAYIQYTSGSTGNPKGVMVSHRSAAFVRDVCIASNRLTDGDQVALFSSLWFSHIWASLATGACLHMYDLANDGVSGIADWLDDKAISIYSTFPTGFRHFIASLASDRQFPSVRVTSLTGESASVSDIEHCRRHFAGDGEFVNCYASTELVYINNFTHKLSEPLPQDPLPIGSSVWGVETLLVDESLRLIVDDELGELVVKTPYLSAGYWRNATATGERYVKDKDGTPMLRTGDVGRRDEDGQIVITGRRDQLVKIGGYQVLPNEVELVLLSYPDIDNVGVTSFLNEFGDRRLVAYYLSVKLIVHHELLRFMNERLAKHMVPALFIRLDELPLTASGKVARQKLQPPRVIERHSRVDYVSATGELESQLITLWESILGVTGIGVLDDFFELGGDSLLATRLLIDVCGTYSVALTPAQFMSGASTIRSMAKEIGRLGQSKHNEPTPSVRLDFKDYAPQSKPVDDQYIEEATQLRRYTPNRLVGEMAINSLGFRSPEIPAVKPQDTLRFAFLGDSLTLDDRVGPGLHGWPQQVLEVLRLSCVDKHMDYLNAALPGCHTRQHMQMYSHNVAPLDPDVVVLQVSDALIDSIYAARAAGVYDGVAHHRSSLAKNYPWWHLIEMNGLIVWRLALAHRKMGKFYPDVDALARAFEERLRKLSELCLERATLLVFVTLCSRLRVGQSLLERLRGAETSVYFGPHLHIDSFIDLHDAYNDVIRTVAKDYAAPVIEPNVNVPTGRQYFFDSMHLRPAGGRLLAQAMAKQLLADPTFRRLTSHA